MRNFRVLFRSSIGEWILPAIPGADHVAVNSRNAAYSGLTSVQRKDNVCDIVLAFIRRQVWDTVISIVWDP